MDGFDLSGLSTFGLLLTSLAGGGCLQLLLLVSLALFFMQGKVLDAFVLFSLPLRACALPSGFAEAWIRLALDGSVLVFCAAPFCVASFCRLAHSRLLMLGRPFLLVS